MGEDWYAIVMGKEDECGVRCQEYQFCSSPKGLIWGRIAGTWEFRSLHMHDVQIYTTKDGLRKKIFS